MTAPPNNPALAAAPTSPPHVAQPPSAEAIPLRPRHVAQPPPAEPIPPLLSRGRLSYVPNPAEPLLVRAREALALHGDPRHGSRYWLDFQQAHGLRLADLATWGELFALPPMDPDALRTRPIEDFVPLALHPRRASWLAVQTGGASGPPATTCYLPEDFEAAFVTPFLAAVERLGFPRRTGRGWLFVGPTGPHVIGRAADVLARRLGAPGIFAIDFDPRWFRKMAPGSMGRNRYLAHVIDQAMAVLDQQRIGVLFATPPALAALAERMTAAQRAAIRGVHYGGTALSADTLAKFQNDLFPEAVHLSGYGNTLFGCALELTIQPGRTPVYFPHGERLRFALADAGATVGRVRFCRVDPSGLILNQFERDQAALAPPPEDDWARAGFVSPGLRNPAPVETAQRPDGGSQGIY